MKKIIILILAGIMLLSLAACSQPANTPAASPLSGELLKSDKSRINAPSVSPTDSTSLVNGNSTFAFNLYQALKSNDGNLFYSPYSISEALAMTYGGARGNTEKQMAQTLSFLLSQDLLHPAFNNLDQELAKRGQGAQGADGKGFRLNVVNAIWGQQGFSFLPAYLDLLAQNYGAGLRILDFAKSPEPSRNTINQWVLDQTEGKIKDLIPQGAIDSATRLVLTNAIYFNAAWLNPFNESMTANGAFHLLNGKEVTVPMMKQTAYFKYMKGDNYQAIEIPYDGQELSMVVFMPTEGQFKNFEDSLTHQQVSSIISQKIGSQQVILSMPKFKFESSFSLKETLSGMGMQDAFNNADFSGIDGNKDLFIGDVVHKAFVAVNEAGTEAAAATGVMMPASAPLSPPVMTLDRPFIFLIRDIKTGAVIFIGRVMDPTT